MFSKDTLRRMAEDQGAKLSEIQLDLVKAQLDKLREDLDKVPQGAIENVQPEMSYEKREAGKG
jgi:hypothetical protein